MIGLLEQAFTANVKQFMCGDLTLWMTPTSESKLDNCINSDMVLIARSSKVQIGISEHLGWHMGLLFILLFT